MRFRLTVSVVFLLALSGCTYWRRANISPATRFPPDQQVQLWSRGVRTTLVQVRVATDSVYGNRAECVPCPVAVPRAAVDSLKVPQGPGVFGAVMAGLGFAVVMLIVGLSQGST